MTMINGKRKKKLLSYFIVGFSVGHFVTTTTNNNWQDEASSYLLSISQIHVPNTVCLKNIMHMTQSKSELSHISQQTCAWTV